MKLLFAYIIGLLTLPLLALACAFLGLLPSRATSSPPGWEVSIAGRALDGSLEHRASGVKDPFGNGAKAAVGADALFDKDCSACHGNKEHTSKLIFYPRAPQFFAGNDSDLEVSEAYAAIHDGIRYSAMPAWSRQLSDADMWKLAHFVAKGSGKGDRTHRD